LGKMIGERFSCSEDWQRLKGKRLRVVQVD
jgi:hypothetical protein